MMKDDRAVSGGGRSPDGATPVRQRRTGQTGQTVRRVGIACAALFSAVLTVASGAKAQTQAQTQAANSTTSTAPAAAAVAPAPRVARSEVGHATVAWLDLQRSNAQAAPDQPMLGEEAGLAYRRYMESFNSKIPALFGSALTQGSAQGGGTPSPQN